MSTAVRVSDGAEAVHFRPMELKLGLLADAANMTENKKLNLLGVFTNITADDYPALHPLMQLVLQFTADPVERGQEKDLQVTLVEDDGGEVLKVTGKIRIPEESPVGQPSQMLLQLPLVNTAFPHEGGYAFVIQINGETKGRVAFTMSRTAGAEGA